MIKKSQTPKIIYYLHTYFPSSTNSSSLAVGEAVRDIMQSTPELIDPVLLKKLTASQSAKALEATAALLRSEVGGDLFSSRIFVLIFLKMLCNLDGIFENTDVECK